MITFAHILKNNSMEKLLILIVLIFTFFVSCNTEIDLTEDGPSIPIVYAVLDHNDTIYVRINKSFNGNQSSYDMAKHPDSILYTDDLKIDITILNSKGNEVGKKLDFEKKTLTKDSVNAQGNIVFSVDKHYVYVSKGKFDPLPVLDNYSYNLEIKKDGKKIAWATTQSLNQFSLVTPGLNHKVKLVKSSREPLSTSWKNPGGHAKLIKIDVTIIYYEYNKKENRFYEKEVYASTGTISTSSGGQGIPGAPIIDNIIKKIEKEHTPDIEKRFIGRMIVDYYVANQDYGEQILLYGGIGSINFETSPVTNISGGFGLFGSKIEYRREPVFFDGATIDEFSKLTGMINNEKVNLKFEKYIDYSFLPDSLPWK